MTETRYRKRNISASRALSVIDKRINKLTERVEMNPHFTYDAEERSALKWLLNQREVLLKENMELREKYAIKEVFTYGINGSDIGEANANMAESSAWDLGDKVPDEGNL